jgi:hypothetical protein
VTLQGIWNGSQLKLTFRRNFNSSLMQLWYELEAIANNISFFFGSSDDLIWQYKNKVFIPLLVFTVSSILVVSNLFYIPAFGIFIYHI